MCKSVHVSLHIIIYMTIHTSVHVSIRMPVHMSVHMDMRMSMRMSIRMSMYLSMHMLMHMSMHMSMHMPMHMFITIHDLSDSAVMSSSSDVVPSMRPCELGCTHSSRSMLASHDPRLMSSGPALLCSADTSSSWSDVDPVFESWSDVDPVIV